MNKLNIPTTFLPSRFYCHWLRTHWTVLKPTNRKKVKCRNTFSIFNKQLRSCVDTKSCLRCKALKKSKSKICGRKPLKNLKWYGPICESLWSLQICSKGNLPQILLVPFLHTLPLVRITYFKVKSNSVIVQ